MSTLHGLEAITVARWLYTTLTTDPDLQDLLGGPQEAAKRVVEGQYEGDATLWITYTLLEPQDVRAVGLVPIAAMVQFQMKVVGRATSYGPLIPVYQRAHALLDGKTNQEPAQGGIVLTAQRVSGVQFPERANGIQYRHLGGLYETLTQ